MEKTLARALPGSSVCMSSGAMHTRSRGSTRSHAALGDEAREPVVAAPRTTGGRRAARRARAAPGDPWSAGRRRADGLVERERPSAPRPSCVEEGAQRHRGVAKAPALASGDRSRRTKRPWPFNIREGGTSAQWLRATLTSIEYVRIPAPPLSVLVRACRLELNEAHRRRGAGNRPTSGSEESPRCG